MYGRPPAAFGSIRRILPSSVPRFWALPREPCWSPRAAAVADPDVEVVVRPEQQQAAVVVGLGVGDLHQLARRARVGDVLGPSLVLDDRLVAVGVGVEDVEEPAGGVVGRERDRQQPLLGAGRDLVGHVEERRAERLAVLDDADLPALLDHEQPAVVLRRRGHVDGRVERADLLQAHRALGLLEGGPAAAGPAPGEHEQDDECAEPHPEGSSSGRRLSATPCRKRTSASPRSGRASRARQQST